MHQDKRYYPRPASLRCLIRARLLNVSRLPCVDAHERGPHETVLFKCFRSIETLRPRVNAFAVIMASQSTAFVHLAPVRARSDMIARDVLYNDLRQYLQDQGVALPLARTKRRNGDTNARRAERHRLTTQVPQAFVNVISPPAEAADIPTTSTAPRNKRGRKQSNLAATRPRRASRARV